MAIIAKMDPSYPLESINLFPFLNSNSTNYELLSEAVKVMSACDKYGIFSIDKHALSELTVQRAVVNVEEFFQKPPEFKDRVASRTPGRARDYTTSLKEATDGPVGSFQAFDLYKSTSPAERDSSSSGTLMEENRLRTLAGFRESLEDLNNEILRLAYGIAFALDSALAYCLGDVYSERGTILIFEQHTRNAFWASHSVHYRPVCNAVLARSSHDIYGVHKEPGLFTILVTDGTSGLLQIQAENGHWVDVNPASSSLVVILGESTENITNTIWKSPTYRLAYKNVKESQCLFFHTIHPNRQAKYVLFHPS
jgi:isopenicillin N synthase-like dioxygenase